MIFEYVFLHYAMLHINSCVIYSAIFACIFTHIVEVCAKVKFFKLLFFYSIGAEYPQ